MEDKLLFFEDLLVGLSFEKELCCDIERIKKNIDSINDINKIHSDPTSGKIIAPGSLVYGFVGSMISHIIVGGHVVRETQTKYRQYVYVDDKLHIHLIVTTKKFPLI